jgi:pyruvate kinase
VAILQDLQGPKLRLGTFAEGRVELVAGETVLLVARPGVVGSPRFIPVPLPSLARDVRPGDSGAPGRRAGEARVLRIRGQDVEVKVEVGGPISDHKGVSLPGAAVSIPAFTPKDRRDAALGRTLGVDLVAMSFVRTARDVERARRHLAPGTPLIAKMEKPQAIENLEAILRIADGVMVARGDLGVELPLERVPGIQKRLVRQANLLGRPCIVATEMLESMVQSPRPTRAEVSDVANAVLDGADAVMLSAETAVGHDPVAAVATMARIVEEASAPSGPGSAPRSREVTSHQESPPPRWRRHGAWGRRSSSRTPRAATPRGWWRRSVHRCRSSRSPRTIGWFTSSLWPGESRHTACRGCARRTR